MDATETWEDAVRWLRRHASQHAGWWGRMSASQAVQHARDAMAALPCSKGADGADTGWIRALNWLGRYASTPGTWQERMDAREAVKHAAQLMDAAGARIQRPWPAVPA